MYSNGIQSDTDVSTVARCVYSFKLDTLNFKPILRVIWQLRMDPSWKGFWAVNNSEKSLVTIISWEVGGGMTPVSLLLPFGVKIRSHWALSDSDPKIDGKFR